LDFSALSFLPTFVAVTAHPETKLFMEQLDLALAAAAFDLEPVLLILGEAELCFGHEYIGTSQAKKLASAEIYGVKACLSGEQAHAFLTREMDESALIALEFCQIPFIPELSSLAQLQSGVDLELKLNADSRFLVV
jgi:hypothetical protein